MLLVACSVAALLSLAPQDPAPATPRVVGVDEHGWPVFAGQGDAVRDTPAGSAGGSAGESAAAPAGESAAEPTGAVAGAARTPTVGTTPPTFVPRSWSRKFLSQVAPASESADSFPKFY